jgi:hypothetical protein
MKQKCHRSFYSDITDERAKCSNEADVFPCCKPVESDSKHPNCIVMA